MASNPEPAPAPVALFVYRRPAHTRRTLESLAANSLAAVTTLHVYSDGPKAGEDPAAVAEVRALLRERAWCCEVHLHEAPENRGLAASILAGVEERLRESETVIVLEDDLELAPGFLAYMNDALRLYRDEPRVMQLAAFLPELETPLPETFFLRLTSSWGWATWRRAWTHLRTDAAALAEEIRRTGQTAAFNLDDAYDYLAQMDLNAAGQLRTWAILWYASVFLADGLVLHPGRSLVRNLGNDESGTHGRADGRFATSLAPEPVVVRPIPLAEHAGARAALRRRYAGSRVHRLWKFLRRWL